MAGIGAPLGNNYAAKGTRWRNAIDKALELKCKSDGQKALIQIATAMLDKAADGDMTAIKELGDRIDGKVAQSLNIGGQDDNPLKVEEIVRTVIGPKATDTDS
jgi:hypothetical protein